MDQGEPTGTADSYTDFDLLCDWQEILRTGQAPGGEGSASPPELAGMEEAIEKKVLKSRTVPLLVLIRRSYGLTLRQQWILASLLFAGPQGATGREVCTQAWLPRRDGVNWGLAERELADLVATGLVEPRGRPQGSATMDWAYRSSESLASLSTIALQVSSGRGRPRPEPRGKVKIRVNLLRHHDAGPTPAGEEPASATDGTSGDPDEVLEILSPSSEEPAGAGAAPASAPRPAADPEPLSWKPDRLELEQWVLAFKSRLAIHLWLKHSFDPYCAYPGNQAREINRETAERLLSNAQAIENGITTGKGERPETVGVLSRMFNVSLVEARIILYLFLVEYTDTALPAEGRSVLLAVREPGGGLENAVTPLLPRESLLSRDILRMTRPGRSIYSSEYRLTRHALTCLMGDYTGPRHQSRALGPDREVLGDIKEPRVTLDDLVVPQPTRDAILDALAMVNPHAQKLVQSPELNSLFYKARGSIFLFEGPPGTGKTMAAEAIAHQLGKSLYVARFERIADLWIGELEKNVVRVFEEAADFDAVLVLDEADALISSRTGVRQAWDKAHNSAVSLFLSSVEEYPGTVILTTNLATNIDPAMERRLTSRVRFGIPGPEEREKLWQHHLGALLPLDGDLDLKWLGHRFVLTGARIRNAVLSAMRKALREMSLAVLGKDPAAGVTNVTPEVIDPPTRLILKAAEVVEAARQEARNSFRDRSTSDMPSEPAELGELRIPSISLDQVILSPDIRDQIEKTLVSLRPEARSLFESESFLKTFRTGRGVVLLFEGPPGTGKTLTAEAIAGELGKVLYLVSTEKILSKWFGQSERYLARAFDEAEAHEAILLLDEADSFLHHRGDAYNFGTQTHNNMVNILLNRLENSTGITILTTNFPQVLDKALDRRLSAHLTFPMPDADQRTALLRQHLPDEITLGADVDLRDLAVKFPISGGKIRNAVLTAIRQMIRDNPQGRTLTRRHLEQALDETARSQHDKKMGFRLEGLGVEGRGLSPGGPRGEGPSGPGSPQTGSR